MQEPALLADPRELADQVAGWPASAVLALAGLVLFGSVIAFTSYMNTLRRLPYRVVMTYAYANPVIAVFLGWLILDERVTAWTLAGALLVVAGVAGIFQNRD